MLTSLIEQYADIGGISSPDLNLKVLLRREVCPAFFADIGHTSWRRVVGSLSVVQGTAAYDLADDLGEMVELHLGDDLTKAPIQYIGEDPDKLLAASLATTQARPTGYFLVRRATTLVFKRLQFNCPPDAAYANCKYVYFSLIPFADDTTDVELDKYIPAQFQWGLVEGLKKQIMFHRVGIGDPRYIASEQEYGTWVARALDNKELARRNYPVFAR